MINDRALVTNFENVKTVTLNRSAVALQQDRIVAHTLTLVKGESLRLLHNTSMTGSRKFDWICEIHSYQLVRITRMQGQFGQHSSVARHPF